MRSTYLIQQVNVSFCDQMESLPPSSYLRTYLNGHGKWDTFLPQLKVSTGASIYSL
jgi:hypothetical protein